MISDLTPENTKLKKPLVLIVDDDSINLEVMSNVLSGEGYRVALASSGRMALEFVKNELPDIVLLDIIMPGMSGYEVMSVFKNEQSTKNVPVIFFTSRDDDSDEERGLSLGAVDYITKPIRGAIVKARIKNHLALYDNSRLLEHLVEERTMELQETRLEIIRRLGRAAEYRDNETGIHVIRMSKYSYTMAIGAGMGPIEANLILNASPMHDIGKIGIPDRILLKEGPLTAEEMAIVHTHCQIGADIIADHPSDIIRTAKIGALTHHERWDGSGYPNKLKGNEIPRLGRILAIADVFDALTSKRPYKKPWSFDDAYNFIKEDNGRHFDPELVSIFVGNISEIRRIYDIHSDVSIK